MNGPSQVIANLLAAFPEFEEAWTEYTSSELYGQDEPYNHLGRLAAFLVDRTRASDTNGFDRLFETIEDLLVHSTPDVRTLIVVGFLEDLQNISLNNGVTLDSWERWLGPTTTEAWGKVMDVWTGKLAPDDFSKYLQAGGA
jgi:hypothetical protein